MSGRVSSVMRTWTPLTPVDSCVDTDSILRYDSMQQL